MTDRGRSPFVAADWLPTGMVVGIALGLFLGQPLIGILIGSLSGFTLGIVCEMWGVRAREAWMKMRATPFRGHAYELILAIALGGAVLIVILVLTPVLNLEQGTFLAVLGATMVSVLLFNETREDRLSQTRPLVLVELRYSSTPNNVYLVIRNVGLGAATDIGILIDKDIRDKNGNLLNENIYLQNKIAFLAPGRSLSIALDSDTLLDLYIEFAPVRYSMTEDFPPQKPIEVGVGVRYRDLITGREYQSTYSLNFGASAYGWSEEAG